MADGSAPSEEGRRGTLRAFAGVLTTLITVAAIGGSAYWLYMNHRETRLTTWSYRALTLLGRQLNSQLDAARDQLRARMQTGTVSACSKDVSDSLPGFQCDDERDWPSVVSARPDLVPRDAVKTYFTHVDGHARVHLCIGAADVNAITQSDATVPPSAAPLPSAKAKSSPTATTTPRPTAAPLPCATAGTCGTSGSSAAPQPSASPPTEPHARPLCLSKSVDDVLNGLRWTPLGFDALVVTTADGRVVAQQGSLTQRLTTLGDGIFAADSMGPAPKASPDPKAVMQRPISSVRMASAPETTLLAGTRYLLFSWGPIPSDDAADACHPDGDALWVVGFVPGDPFRANVQRIPYSWLITSLTLLLLMTFSWQLLKLRWLAPQERLSAVDVQILAVSILAIAGTMTVLVYAYDAHLVRADRQEKDLKTLAGDVRKNLREDLLASTRQVWSYRDTLRHCTRLAECDPPPKILAPSLTNLLLLDDSGHALSWFAPAPDPNPPDSLARLVNPTKITFSDRGYFQSAMSNQMWNVSLGPETPPAPQHIAVDVIRSRTSSAYQLVVAVPFVPAGMSQRFVIAAGADPRPFLAPILPEGFGFAVVDDFGNVLLHSENSRNLAENLFNEAEENPVLRMAVATHTSNTFTMRYSADDYVARVEPMEEPGESIPWSIVVFRDKTVVRTLDAETLFVAATAFACHVALLIALLALLQAAGLGPRAHWLWPDRRRARVTAGFVVAGALVATGLLMVDSLQVAGIDVRAVFGALVLAFGMSRAVLDGAQGRSIGLFTVLAGGAVLVATRVAVTPWSVLVLALLWASVWATPSAATDDGPLASERRFRTGYVLLLAATVFVIACVPAALMAIDSARHVDATFDRLVHQQMQEGRVQRDARIMAATSPSELSRRAHRDDRRDVYELANPHLPVNDHDDPVGASQAAPGGAPATADARQDDANESDSPARLLFSVLPALGELSGRLHSLPGALAATSTTHASTSSTRWSSIALAVVVSIVLLYLLADTARRVFLLDIDADTPDGARPIPRGSHLVRPRKGAAPAAAEVPSDRLDAGRGTEHILAGPRKASPLHSDRRVTITNVDLALDDEAARAVLLRLLGDLVSDTDAEIELTSSDDLLHHVLRPAQSAPSADAKQPPSPSHDHATAVSAWLRLLDNFSSRPDTQGSTAGAKSDAGYWLTWRRRSRAERLALRQLADEGFLNPNNGDVVRDLIVAGLVHRDRGLEFRDKAFAAFVRHAVPRTVVRRWEREGVHGGWEDVRAHLATVLAVAGTFIFVTQPDLLNTVALTIAGVTAGVPTLMKLVSLFGSDKRDAH